MKIVSFDFDWTLKFPNGTPVKKSVKLLKWLLKHNRKVYIVTSREDDKFSRDEINDFIKEQDIVGLAGVFFTDGNLKCGTLHRLGVQHHFDDDAEELDWCHRDGIKGHQVWSALHEEIWKRFYGGMFT